MRWMKELLGLFWFLDMSPTVPDTGRKLAIVFVDDTPWLQNNCSSGYLSRMGQVESDSALLRAIRCIPAAGGTDADRAAYGVEDRGLGWYGNIFDAARAFRQTIDALPLRRGAKCRRIVDGYVCDVFNITNGERWVRELNEFIEGHEIQLDSAMAQNRWHDYVAHAESSGVHVPDLVSRIFPKSNVDVLCRYVGIDRESGKLNCDFITVPCNSSRTR